jgi:DnaD/phage-associated family protein
MSVKNKKLISSAFPSPNYTQVPNDFFILAPDLGDAELRVSLVMIRETFGYHRENFRMSIRKLAIAAGLSRNGAKAGAEAAENRGTFRRMYQNGQGSAEWELIVIDTLSASDRDGSLVDPHEGQLLTHSMSTSDPQLGIKESIKENKTNTATADSNNFTLYESNIGPLTPMISEAIKDAEKTYTQAWVARAILEAAKSNVRKMKYIEGILLGYAKRGSPDIGCDFVKPTRTKQADPMARLREIANGN